MQQYIQRRLNMTPGEAERFSPIFVRYIVDLRRTHREVWNYPFVWEQWVRR